MDDEAWIQARNGDRLTARVRDGRLSVESQFADAPLIRLDWLHGALLVALVIAIIL